MLRKLERWVWLGGAALAVNGGMINAVGLSCFARQTVSHVTGTTTLFSLALAHRDAGAVAHMGGILGSFAAGAMAAGFMVENATLKLGRRYAAVLWLECALISAAAIVIAGRPFAGLALASAACGLQNAMASTYSGAVLRTSHMTGIVTDLGAAAGHWLRSGETDWLRVRFYGGLLGAFGIGAAAGGLLFGAIGFKTLWIPAALTASLASAYGLFLRSRRAASPAGGTPRARKALTFPAAGGDHRES